MRDLLAEYLSGAIPEEWQNGRQPAYFLYDRLSPHCAASVGYKQAFPKGVWRFYCRHDVPSTTKPEPKASP